MHTNVELLETIELKRRQATWKKEVKNVALLGFIFVFSFYGNCIDGVLNVRIIV